MGGIYEIGWQLAQIILFGSVENFNLESDDEEVWEEDCVIRNMDEGERLSRGWKEMCDSQ